MKKKIGILSTIGGSAPGSGVASIRKVLSTPGGEHGTVGMRRVSYCGGSFVTTGQVAEALVSLITTLANGHRTQTIEIPAVSDDGNLILVVLIVGPFSGLMSIPEYSPWPAPDLSDTVKHLRILAAMASDIPFSGFSDTVAILDYDWNESFDFG
ncbi:hypothetical protein [Cryobacterium sp. MDB2-33-2]|uniref:hypothetical protein n=1 Tax=Cryobacterium sp. MDB2-33-2 TaxID=1259179 RepID=UPI00106ADE17|nr:hypothetical protein [Cryobacterium sp. MDB2-33-2]TFC04041.1 hypothetical protein E3O59_14975 [Cryobacterium sp. MDB2-33-2]